MNGNKSPLDFVQIFRSVMDELERIISSWLISLGVVLANISFNLKQHY